jgi:anaphase-promoting complex subunit 6
MEKFLRDWRQDALNKHQYDSAIFIGDKLLALTSMTPHVIAMDNTTDALERQ